MTSYKIYIPTTGERETLNEIKVYLDSCDADYITLTNKEGKDGFWRVWNVMLAMVEKSNEELIIFMPDDFTDLDIDRILEIHEEHKATPYAFNINNYGKSGWYNGVVPVTIDNKIMCGFVDCGFFCNREALELIGFDMTQTKVTADSSGVGRELSNRFLKARVPMYKPVVSLAYHFGYDESIMHPEERKKNPLISL